MVATEGWLYDTLPNVNLCMMGDIRLKPDNVDVEDEKKRSHFDQYFNWRIDEDTDEFVIRILRKPEAPTGHTTVALKIEGGLTEQPDGSVLFDGGVGNAAGNGVSKFGLSFEISHESYAEEEAEEEPEVTEIKFFDHPEHKLLLAPENFYKDVVSGYTCDACTEPFEKARAKWVYECPHRECDYCVHAACAQLSRTIRHPSHPKHPLKLFKLSPASYTSCDVCKGDIHRGLHYHCAKCDFDLHPVCPEAEAEEDSNADEKDADEAEEDCVEAEEDCVEAEDAAPNMKTPMTEFLNFQTELMQQQMQLNMVTGLSQAMANFNCLI